MQKKFLKRSQLHPILITKTSLPKQTYPLIVQAQPSPPLPLPIVLLQQRLPNLQLTGLSPLLPIRYTSFHRPNILIISSKHNLTLYNIYLTWYVIIC